MNPLSGTGMALEDPPVQCRNVRMWVSQMEEISTMCQLWREELLTKARVGTWMEAKRAVCLSEDRGSCVSLWSFKREVCAPG